MKSFSAFPAGTITCTNDSSGGAVTGATVVTGKSSCSGGDVCHCGVGIVNANCDGVGPVVHGCDEDLGVFGHRSLGVVRFTWNGVAFQSNFVQLGGAPTNPATGGADYLCRMAW